MSFSRIVPDLIGKWDSGGSDTFTIIKPDKFKDVKVTVWDKDIRAKKFIDIPKIVEIVPKIKQAFPFGEPKKKGGEYFYEYWRTMIIKKRGSWL